MTLDVKQLALYLGVSEVLIRQMVRENKIPYFRIGRRILFYEDDIIRFIRNQYSEGMYGKK